MNYLKEKWLLVSTLLIVIFIFVLSSLFASTTITRDKIYEPAWKSSCIQIVLADDFNNVTTTMGTVQGTLTAIYIDSNGTDTSYKVYLKDENGYAVFTKENCSSDTEPYKYALYLAGADGNNYQGIPVSGSVSLQIADANNVSLNALTVKVYYDEK